MDSSKVTRFRLIMDHLALSDYHGLENQGATCYLSSVLQVLFMTNVFREAVKRCSPGSAFIDPHLRRLFFDLEASPGSTYNITKILGITKLYEQRDAAEHLEKILSRTSQEAAQIFKGRLTHSTTCSRCGKQNNVDGLFWTLPLSMDSSRQQYRVKDGFEAFFALAKVNGADKIYCDDCDAKSDATMECKMKCPPEILTLLLKRFQFDPDRMSFVKLTCCVEVPKILQIESCTYELYATVNHFGSIKGGHYTATVKSFETGYWHDFNDAHVQLVKPPPFSSGCSTMSSSSAYLLMYKKVGTKVAALPCQRRSSHPVNASPVGKHGTREGGDDHTHHRCQMFQICEWQNTLVKWQHPGVEGNRAVGELDKRPNQAGTEMLRYQRPGEKRLPEDIQTLIKETVGQMAVNLEMSRHVCLEEGGQGGLTEVT